MLTISLSLRYHYVAPAVLELTNRTGWPPAHRGHLPHLLIAGMCYHSQSLHFLKDGWNPKQIFITESY